MAEMVLAEGADFVGVIVFPGSPRHVETGRISEILSVVPRGRRVMVDVAPSTVDLETGRDMGFDFFQIHFPLETTMADLAAWAGIVGRSRLWVAPKISEETMSFPQILLEFADTVVLDTWHKNLYGGTGQTGDWRKFQDWSTLFSHKKWILAGGLNPGNVREAVSSTGAELVDVNSGVESAPGIKDPQLLRELFRALR